MKTGYYMHPEHCGGTSFADVVRSEFRSDTEAADDALDVGIYCLKKASMLLSLFEKLSDGTSTTAGTTTVPGESTATSSATDTSAGKGDSMVASAVAANVAPVPDQVLGPGKLLVSHPLMEGPFRRAVILILEHNDKGSYGLVVNKATDYSLASAVRNFPEDVLSVFGTQPVQYGGPVRRLQYIHPLPGLTGSLQVPNCPDPHSLFYGGAHLEATAAAKDGLSRGQDFPADFHFFVGCCTWRPGQMEDEVKYGCWFVAEGADYGPLLKLTQDAANAHLKTTEAWDSEEEEEEHEVQLQQQEQGNATTLSDGEGRTTAEVMGENGGTKTIFTDGRDVDDKAGAWPLLMQGMGMPYAGLSAIPFWLDTSVIEACDWGK